MTDLDGNLMLPDEADCYHRATEVQQQEWQAMAAEHTRQREIIEMQRAERRRTSRARTQDVMEEDNSSHFAFPSIGKVRGLVVLVEYQDIKFTVEDPYQTYCDMMMKPGFDYTYNNYVHQGSANDYFYQNSAGLFDPQFDVYGPLTLKYERSYYGENRGISDIRPHEMIIEACQQLDSLGVDFSLYDENGDDIIDFVFAVFAGPGENAGDVTSSAVWPHAWNLTSAGQGGKYYFDGKKLDDYACTCELYDNHLDGVGTFCHEFSHVLGLPDLYDINYNADAPFNYSVLDNGCYRNGGYCPLGYSAYERYELGWLNPTKLPDEAATLSITDLGLTNQAFILPVTPDSLVSDIREGEYYLFENRQKNGWDSYIPGHGMLVWHIDYVESKWWNNKVNTWTNHQCVDLIEADGVKKKANGLLDQKGSEPFPGTMGHTEFTDDTTPAFSGWSKPGNSSGELGHRLEHPLTNIQEIMDEQTGLSVITFDLLGGTAALQNIEQDHTQTNPGIVLLNGRLMLQTANGSYDAMGRKWK